MALPQVNPGELVDLRVAGEGSAGVRMTAIVKTEAFQAIRLVVPSGRELPRHQVAGEITIQCLEGRIAFTACGATREMEAGHWLYLPANEPHSLVGIEDATLLLTHILRDSRP